MDSQGRQNREAWQAQGGGGAPLGLTAKYVYFIFIRFYLLNWCKEIIKALGLPSKNQFWWPDGGIIIIIIITGIAYMHSGH